MSRRTEYTLDTRNESNLEQLLALNAQRVADSKEEGRADDKPAIAPALRLARHGRCIVYTKTRSERIVKMPRRAHEGGHFNARGVENVPYQ